MSKPPVERNDPHRQIIPKPDDPAMYAWLVNLFNLTPRQEGERPFVDEKCKIPKPKATPDSFPEKIVIRQMFGPKGLDLGPPQKPKEWKGATAGASTPSHEELIDIANDYLQFAQTECNKMRRRNQKFGLFAYSNRKGSDAYDHYTFVLSWTRTEYGEKGGLPVPASDDEDTHRDRFFQDLAANGRWQTEHYTEAVSGVLKLQQEIIRQQADTIFKQDERHRATVTMYEEAASKQMERINAAKWMDMKIEAAQTGLRFVTGLLPAVQTYLTKGKIGPAEGVRQFIDSLSEDEARALFGDNVDGVPQGGGILTGDQVQFVFGVAGGQIDPRRIGEFVTSLTGEQMLAIQNLLPMDRLAGLFALNKAVESQSQQENGAS